MKFQEKQSLVALMHFLWLGAYEKALNSFSAENYGRTA